MILFLALLPLLNAGFDFASAGLTRFLLRRGVQGRLVWNALRDAAAAVLILVLLGFAMVSVIHVARPQGGRALIDLAALFADLRANPGDYYWLYFCFFSTLLPTVLHLGVGLFGFFTLFSGWVGRPVAAGLMAADEATARFASLAFVLCAAAAVWTPVFLIWRFLAFFGEPILGALLDLFEGYARLIGAI